MMVNLIAQQTKVIDELGLLLKLAAVAQLQQAANIGNVPTGAARLARENALLCMQVMANADERTIDEHSNGTDTGGEENESATDAGRLDRSDNGGD